MEQATLVRHAVDEPSDPSLGEDVVASSLSPGSEVPGSLDAQPSLADDEVELLAEIATGATTEVAARRLDLSTRTLRRRLRTICDRLDVNTPIEAVVWAARKQLI